MSTLLKPKEGDLEINISIFRGDVSKNCKGLLLLPLNIEKGEMFDTLSRIYKSKLLEAKRNKMIELQSQLEEIEEQIY